MRVRFLRAAVYRAAAPYHKPGELSYVPMHFAEGEEYDLADDLAQRFVNRKSAVAVAAKAPAKEPEPVKPIAAEPAKAVKQPKAK